MNGQVSRLPFLASDMYVSNVLKVLTKNTLIYILIELRLGETILGRKSVKTTVCQGLDPGLVVLK